MFSWRERIISWSCSWLRCRSSRSFSAKFARLTAMTALPRATTVVEVSGTPCDSARARISAAKEPPVTTATSCDDGASGGVSGGASGASPASSCSFVSSPPPSSRRASFLDDFFLKREKRRTIF